MARHRVPCRIIEGHCQSSGLVAARCEAVRRSILINNRVGATIWLGYMV